MTRLSELVVDAVGEPRVGFSVAVDAVEGAVGELDVPVVAVGGLGGPPGFFQRPGAGGDADGAGDVDFGFGGLEFGVRNSDGSRSFVAALLRMTRGVDFGFDGD